MAHPPSAAAAVGQDSDIGEPPPPEGRSPQWPRAAFTAGPDGATAAGRWHAENAAAAAGAMARAGSFPPSGDDDAAGPGPADALGTLSPKARHWVQPHMSPHG